jgi:hypothetical protein
MESGSRTGAGDGGDPGDAGAKVKVNERGPAGAGEASPFPSIMTDEQVDAAAATRRYERHDPFRRKERPDPWPIIERGFPRIAEKIKELWGKRALDDYFAKLVVDERGGRQGFPPDVLTAILEVARLHTAQHRFHRPMCPWEADVSQTKWWSRGT